MNSLCRRDRTDGFSLVELMVLLVVGGLFLGLVLPGSRGCRGRSPRIACVNNLKQVGIAFRVYAMDYDGAYPWQRTLAGTNGTRVAQPKVPFTQSTSSDLLGLFLVLSNELSTPRIAVCPADSKPSLASNSWAFAAAHPRSAHRSLGYFVGLDSQEEKPDSILAGDRNITNDPAQGPAWQDVVETTPAWVPGDNPKAYRNLGFDAKTMHKSAGNILLGDGSVQQVSNGRLRDAMEASTRVATTAWLFPVDH